MGWFEIGFIYVVSWWMLLFMLLPLRAGAAEQPEANEYHAAPKKAYLKEKLIGATLLAVLVTFALSFIMQSGMIESWLPYRF